MPLLPLPDGRLSPASGNDPGVPIRLLHQRSVRLYLYDDVVLTHDAVAALLAEKAIDQPTALPHRLATQGAY